MDEMLAGLPRNHYGAILADPPWAFNLWWGGRTNETPAGDPIRAIRWLLKVALRRFGLRCSNMREI